MGIYKLNKEFGDQGVSRRIPVSTNPTELRKSGFYTGSQFQKQKDYVEYVAVNKELQGFQKLSELIGAKQKNIRIKQFGNALRRFLRDHEGLTATKTPEKFAEAVDEVLEAR